MNLEDCLFKSNVADEYGGAIACKKNVEVTGSKFIGNSARSRDWSWYEYIYHWMDNPDCKGGAIYSDGDVTIFNSTFENNTSDHYAGAVWGTNVRINHDCGERYEPNTFFINNVANRSDAGAVYAKESINAKNVLCSGNKALVDGGAFFAGSDVNVEYSKFDSNRVEGASSQCYGGAIRAKGDVSINKCTFIKNFAYDYGGAIRAKNIKINDKQDDNESFNTFFYDNCAKDNEGGALYAEKDVIAKNALFKDNSACEHGGGIYSDGTVKVYHCEFDKNNAGDGISSNGGGIYSESGVDVENCTFNGNHCHGMGPAIYCVKDINVNQNSNGKNYKSYFIGNKADFSQEKHQIVCDDDHGKINYVDVEFA